MGGISRALDDPKVCRKSIDVWHWTHRVVRAAVAFQVLDELWPGSICYRCERHTVVVQPEKQTWVRLRVIIPSTKHMIIRCLCVCLHDYISFVFLSMRSVPKLFRPQSSNDHIHTLTGSVLYVWTLHRWISVCPGTWLRSMIMSPNADWTKTMLHIFFFFQGRWACGHLLQFKPSTSLPLIRPFMAWLACFSLRCLSQRPCPTSDLQGLVGFIR